MIVSEYWVLLCDWGCKLFAVVATAAAKHKSKVHVTSAKGILQKMDYTECEVRDH